jgi:monoterpene epsilon-lactone hydrolase
MPSREHQAMVALLVARRTAPAQSIEQQRANYESLLSVMPRPSDVLIEEIQIGRCNADFVSIRSRSTDRVILYLHGGGYVIGSNIAYREFAGRLARATATRVCVLNYRLAPEHPFPAALDDATAAYRWLLERGIAPSRIFIAGDSAGGGLTLATLLALRDAGDPLPAAAVCLSPWTDLRGHGTTAAPDVVDDPLVEREALQAMARLYAPNDLTHPLASPVHADYARIPPLLVLVGSREILLDDAARVAAKARSAGVDVTYFEGKGLIHVWPVLAPTAPESAAALKRIAGFVQANSP